MKIFNSEQIRKIDAFTIESEPIASVDLMERAANQLFLWCRKKYSPETKIVVFAGPGNNGGDAWALTRLLYKDGFTNIRFYNLIISDKLSPDSEINKERLKKETLVSINEINSEADFPKIGKDEWIIDGLFGSGLSRPVEGVALKLVQRINKLEIAGVISIDVPSGLFSENNLKNNPEGIICATHTLSFQFPKLAFMFAENERYVGRWEVLPIGLHQEIINKEDTPYNFIERTDIKAIVRKRDKFPHKGNYGHALIVAGSYGMMGAAVLASRAAVKSGAGLVTTHIPRLGYEIIQSSVPEALTSIDESDLIFTGINHLNNYTAIAIGPGLNTKVNTVKALKEVITNTKVPLVIDADALNILSKNRELIDILPENSILTPHPKEFDRLTMKHKSNYERFVTQLEFSKKHKLVIALKGAHTCISSPKGDVWFNSTGNPGMATGGSGDVLAGIIVSLLAQGYKAYRSAIAGVYLHGLAGDIALKSEGYNALSPSDIINKLGKAFKKIEKK